jgi:dipeptidyl aminopeptidase/acylaminoacyl peptidase
MDLPGSAKGGQYAAGTIAQPHPLRLAPTIRPSSPSTMTRWLSLFLLSLALLTGGVPSETQAQSSEQRTSPLSVEQIMQEPETWIGAWPQHLRWGERGETLYFDWNPKGRFESDSLYRVPAGGGEPQKVSPEERRDGIAFFDGWHHGEHVYGPRQRRKVYADEGDLYLFDRRSPEGAPEKQRLTDTRADEQGPRFSLGGEAVIYRAGDDLFQKHLDTGATRQLTDLRAKPKKSGGTESEDGYVDEQQEALFKTLREEQNEEEKREAARERDRAAQDPPPTFRYGRGRVEQLQLRPGGRFVTFTVEQPPEDAKSTTVLDYVTESGYTRTETARPKVGAPGGSSTLYVQDLKRDTTFDVDLAQLPGAYDVPEFKKDDLRPDSLAKADSAKRKRDLYAFGPYWNAEGTAAVLDVRARDNKDRWLARLDPATGQLTTLDRQHDDAWIAGPGISWGGAASAVGWTPDGDFYFQSEASGFSHLYTLDLETGETTQLTSGDFEVSAPLLSKEGDTWYFRSTEHSPHERHVYRMPAGGGERVRLTHLRGMTDFALAPGSADDGGTLGLLHSKKNRPPEVYLQPAGEHTARRVTRSPTEAWQAYDWRSPEIVRFEASDGAQVPAQIFEPKQPNGAAVLFVHGAGYTQNVVRGWTHYFREYLFHNLLADLGYTVLNVDYRASAGYGRDWRAAVYRHMGSRDLADYVDAQKYLEKTRGIGPERTFIYGGSYGGFLTLMALFTKPEHFGGGAALRSVTDWAHYNDPYTSNILNTPATDSLAYARSSPIYHAEGLDDPLLMAHGIMDTNVQFQDVVRLSQRLIELGKEDWELAVYPVEGHGFTEPSSWTDEYRRILKLIETSVGPKRGETATLEAAGPPEETPTGGR